MRPQLLLAAIFGLVTSSCFSPGDGQAPPLTTLYFPTGIVLDATTTVTSDVIINKITIEKATVVEPSPYLYVASSDFDLQYRSSALASYDLGLMSAIVPRSCTQNTDCARYDRFGKHGAMDTTFVCDNSDRNLTDPTYFCYDPNATPCGAFEVHSPADSLLYPGRCNFIDPNAPQDGSSTLIHSYVGIGAFATDVIFRQNPDVAAEFPARLFLPVRGDATLHWIDLADGVFNCGQTESDDGVSCDDLHRAGNSVFDNTNQLRLPAEPFGVDATADGKYVAVTNQTTGSVSLFSNNWDPGVGARLEYILSGLPSAPVAIAAVPSLVPDPTPAFLVAYTNAAQIDLLRVRADVVDTPHTANTQYPRYLLAAAGTTAIGANSLGFDSRDLVIDDTAWQLCATQCSDDACRAACMKSAAQPSVYASNRAPPSLLVGAMTPDAAYAAGSDELPAFYDSIPLVTGASRVVLGKVKVTPSADNPSVGDDRTNGSNRSGKEFALEQRVFVVCFDSRRIYVYDPKRRVIDAIIDTGRGPYALAIDEQRGLGYVAHFTDSYLGVISLDQRFPQTYASIIASIGQPIPPRASK
jgi:hypothetical protein